MKKYLPGLLMLFLICAFLTGCSKVGAAQNEINNSEPQGNAEAAGEAVNENNAAADSEPQGSSLAAGEAGAENNEVANPDPQGSAEAAEETDTGNGEPPENPAEDEDVDLDISKLNSMLVYSQVVSILDAPDQYLDKTIKLKGQYYALYYEPLQQYCHYVVVGDASMCCQAGIEFIWSGDHTHPDDYPADKKIIEIVGLFSSYEELDETYYALLVDDISVLS